MQNRMITLVSSLSLVWCMGCAERGIDPDDNVGQEESALFSGFWTSFTSDGIPPVSCPSGYAVDAMECTGSNCDNVALHCGHISTSSSPGRFSNFISEELPNNHVECGTNRFMVAVECDGNLCDNMSIQCASFAGVTSDASRCTWSPFFSEEQQFGLLLNGYAAAGIQCRGNNCDDISIFECPVVPL
jgi:hypothetical protein